MGLAKCFASCSDETYPALRCERVHNLHDIGVYWKMPEGKSMRETEASLWASGVLNIDIDRETVLTPDLAEQKPGLKAIFKMANGYVDIFKSLNPALNQIGTDPDNWDQVRGFLHGTVSGFNVNDISGWVTNTLDYELYHELRARLKVLEGDCEMQWIPSPETIQKIHKQLDVRYGPDIMPPNDNELKPVPSPH